MSEKCKTETKYSNENISMRRLETKFQNFFPQKKKCHNLFAQIVEKMFANTFLEGVNF